MEQGDETAQGGAKVGNETDLVETPGRQGTFEGVGQKGSGATATGREPSQAQKSQSTRAGNQGEFLEDELGGSSAAQVDINHQAARDEAGRPDCAGGDHAATERHALERAVVGGGGKRVDAEASGLNRVELRHAAEQF